MKSIVIYKTNTGFTKKYADWIAEQMDCKAIHINCLRALDLHNYDNVIIGEPVYKGRVEGLKPYQKDLVGYKGKLAIFLVGILDSQSKEAKETINRMEAPMINKEQAVFYFEGGLDYNQLSFTNKMLMKLLKQSVKNNSGSNSEEYIKISKSYDNTNIDLIAPLIKYIKTK